MSLPWQSRVNASPLSAPQLDDDLEYLLGQLEPLVCTVATLPASPSQGDTAVVIDATARTFASAVVGGGAIVTVVYYDGSTWRIG